MLRKRVNLFGVWIDDISMRDALLLARKSLKEGQRRCIFTPNLEMIASVKRDGKTRGILNCATLAIPDGIGLLVVARILGKRIDNTVTGIDFGEKALALAEKEGARVFLLGGKRGVAKKAARNLILKHPNLKICGAYHGYFKAENYSAVCKMIEKTSAQILFVCRGFPLQEGFALVAMKKCPSLRLVACLGGSLDIWAGELKRAPGVVRNMHLEWLYRIAQEPSRCARFMKSLDVLPAALKKRAQKMLPNGIKK